MLHLQRLPLEVIASHWADRPFLTSRIPSRTLVTSSKVCLGHHSFGYVLSTLGAYTQSSTNSYGRELSCSSAYFIVLNKLTITSIWYLFSFRTAANSLRKASISFSISIFRTTFKASTQFWLADILFGI